MMKAPDSTTRNPDAPSQNDSGSAPPPTAVEPSLQPGLTRRQSRLLWLMIVFVFVMYFKSRVATSFDSGYSIHLAISLLENGDLDLEEYRDVIPVSDYRVIEVDGVLQSRYPVGPSVVAAPLLSMVESVGKYVFYVWDLDAFIRNNSPAGLERFLGSLFTVASVVLIFHIAHLRVSFGLSMLMLFIAAFCTSAWSVASRAMWQHGPSMLFLGAALYFLLRARDEGRMAQYSGLFLGLAFAMRPTNALVVVLLTIYVALEHRDVLVRFLAWASVIAVPFVAYHVVVFGSPLPWYYSQGSGRFGGGLAFLEAAAGTLVSPGRGLFLYSPIFLFSLVGMALLWRQRRWHRLETCLAAILALHWLAISSWKVWWGGTVFGPRLFADMIPFLMFFLLPVIELLGQQEGNRRRLLAAALTIAIAVSVHIHRSGARYWATWDWNVEPTHIDEDPSRLWDWHDLPFERRKSKLRPEEESG